jgi:hypothetical protein
VSDTDFRHFECVILSLLSLDPVNLVSNGLDDSEVIYYNDFRKRLRRCTNTSIKLRALVGNMHGSGVDLLNLVGVNSYFPRTWYSWSAELTDLPD